MLKRALPLLSVLLALFVALIGFGLLVPAPGAPALSAPRFFVNIAADDGLVAYFKFDKESGTLTHSFPNTGLTGTLSAGATYTSGHPAEITRFDPASLSLSGGSVRINANAALNGLTQTFSVAAWVRRTATGVYHGIYDSGTQTNQWWVFIDNHDHLGFGVRSVANAEYTTTAVITDTNWHHVAVVNSGTQFSSLRLYIDGTLKGTHTIVPLNGPSGAKAIGCLCSEGLAFFAGQIDELRIYERPLSASEVQRLAAGNGCPTAGTSWATAFSDLQCGLDAAPSGQEVWVAVSPQLPHYYLPGTSPTATFLLKDGVALHGGFAGNETSLAQRPFVNFNTFDVAQLAMTPTSWLRGDMLGDDGDNFLRYNDNLHNVVTIVGNNVKLDGFSIQGGNAVGSGGGGLFQFSGSASIEMTGLYANRSATDGGGLTICCGGHASLQNMLLFGNKAAHDGGGAALAGGATVTVSEVTVWQNSAANRGGGISSGGTLREVLSHSTLRDNTAGNGGGHSVAGTSDMRADAVAFQHNTATSGGGGILIANAAGITLTNLELVANQAAEDGGGLLLFGATVRVVNATIVSNTAGNNGGGVGYRAGISLTLANSILWLDAPDELSGSGLSIDIATDHNLAANPQFVRPPDPGDGSWSTIADNDYGDLRLRLSSPAIDAGNNNRVPAGIDQDFDGHPRRVDVRGRADTGVGTAPIVDIGAHEVASAADIFLPLIVR